MTERADRQWDGRRWELPPLILHPFHRGLDAEAALGSVRLSLHLTGLGEANSDIEPLLRGRYAEFHMLSLVGKDTMRWVANCADFAARDETLRNIGVCEQSFADLLVNRTPATVAARFEKWAVVDYRRILSRGIGINAVFPSPPDYSAVSAAFLQEYYAFADCLFACYQGLIDFVPLPADSFSFSIYTSDEYLAILAGGTDKRVE